MIARVATFEGTEEQIDDAVSVIRDEVHPQNALTPGYVEGMFLVDRDSGSGLLISIWQDNEFVERAETRSAMFGRHGALEATGGSRTSVKLYDVVSITAGPR